MVSFLHDEACSIDFSIKFIEQVCTNWVKHLCSVILWCHDKVGINHGRKTLKLSLQEKKVSNSDKSEIKSLKEHKDEAAKKSYESFKLSCSGFFVEIVKWISLCLHWMKTS